MFDKRFRQFFHCIVNYVVEAAEVVDGLNHIIYVDRPISNTDSVGLEYIARLIVRQSASFDMIGVVGQVDLRAVVYTGFHSAGFLYAKSVQQGRMFRPCGFSSRQNGVSRDIPRLACQKCAIYLSICTIIACRS